MIRLLAISGSLRAASINTTLLDAARICAAGLADVRLYEGLGSLPLFNPDLEGREPPAVLDLWKQVDAADGLLIASPEYAHGVSGAMKNCLDWLVGWPPFVNKPVAVLNATPRAHLAFESIQETMRTMNGVVVEEACLLIPLALRVMDAESVSRDPEFRPLILQAVQAFARAIDSQLRDSGVVDEHEDRGSAPRAE